MTDSLLGGYGANGGGSLSWGSSSTSTTASTTSGMSAKSAQGAALAAGMMSSIISRFSALSQQKKNYQNMEDNYLLQLLNQEDERNAMEQNIATARKNFENAQASNKAEQIATSGMKSSDFMDVNRAENVKFNNDVEAMRAEIRNAFHKQNVQTIYNIQRQKKNYAQAKGKAIRQTGYQIAGAIVGGAAGGMTGASIGSSVGEGLGSIGK